MKHNTEDKMKPIGNHNPATLTRRFFLKTTAAAGVGLFLASGRTASACRTCGKGKARALAAIPGGSLDPNRIPKFTTRLLIPGTMPRTSRIGHGATAIDYYEIAVRQFTQHILPQSMGLPATPVWGYGSISSFNSFGYPGATIEARAGVPVRVKWINGLVDGNNRYRPHLLPVDQTLHWANPPGGLARRDEPGTDPQPYTGPVPFITHLHGAHSGDESDGFPEAWYLPNASNIPAGYARVGTENDAFKAKALAKFGVTWPAGSAVFQYPNDQLAATLWFHDHSLGMTRANLYAGPVAFYLFARRTRRPAAGRAAGQGEGDARS